MDPSYSFVRDRLAKIGAFILAYETLKDYLVRTPKSFFQFPGPDGKMEFDAPYEELRALDKDILTASCLWFEARGAITKNDVKSFAEHRRYRHTLVHEMPDRLFSEIEESESKGMLADKLVSMIKILDKVEDWWLREIAGGSEGAEHKYGNFIRYIVEAAFSAPDAMSSKSTVQ